MPAATADPFSIAPRSASGRGRLLVALALAGTAMLFALWSTYGTDPRLADYPGGLETIMLTRRLRGLLEAAALLPVVALFGLVLARWCSPAWLLAMLAPAMLLAARVALPGPIEAVGFDLQRLPPPPAPLAEDEPIVGLVVGNKAVAVPLSSLAARPVLLLSEFDSRSLLIWNASANRVVHCPVGLEVKAADLESLGEPGGSRLVYNRRFGQFIVGMTGRMPDGADPIGVPRATAPLRTTWTRWKARHPNTVVVPPGSRPAELIAPDDPVVVLHTPVRVAVPPGILGALPMNTRVNDTSVLLLRDATGRLRCFDRQLGEDLFVRPERTTGRDAEKAPLKDPTTGTTWSLDGIALDGELKGRRLREFPVEEAVSRALLQRWSPDVQLVDLP